MSNDMMLFDNKSNVPAHIASFLSTESNIDDRLTVPSLSFEGKVWQISVGGDKTKLMRRDKETGDESPVAVLRVVVLDYNKRRGRAYYEGAYDPAKPGSPACWSDDGITPDKNVSEPPASKCDTCPMSVKGSKVSDNGKALTACSQHRMLAVVPSNNLDFEPLRMKIAITSDYDKQSPELEAQGWYAFSNYTDFLRSKGVQHTATLVTKMKFDPGAAYPKLLFSADRWLTEAELAQIAPVTKSEGVAALLAGTWTPAGADGVKKDGAVKEAAETEEPEAPAKVEKKAAKPKPEPKPEPAPAAVEDDDDEDVVLPGKVTKLAEGEGEAGEVIEAKPKSATVSTVVPKDVEDLLKDWGED